MFGLGMMEILMILAIALIVVGPQKLPELAKTLGRAMGEFKRSAQDLKRSMDIESTVKEIDIPKTDVNDVLNKTNDTESADKKSADPYEPPPESSSTASKNDSDQQTDADTVEKDTSLENETDTDDSKPDTPS